MREIKLISTSIVLITLLKGTLALCEGSENPFSFGVKQSAQLQSTTSSDRINQTGGELTSFSYATQVKISRKVSKNLGVTLYYELERIEYRNPTNRFLIDSGQFTHKAQVSGRARISLRDFVSASYEYAQRTFPVGNSLDSLLIEKVPLHGPSLGYHRLLWFTFGFHISTALFAGTYLPTASDGYEIDWSWFLRTQTHLNYELGASWLLTVSIMGAYTRLRTDILIQDIWKGGTALGVTYVLN